MRRVRRGGGWEAREKKKKEKKSKDRPREKDVTTKREDETTADVARNDTDLKVRRPIESRSGNRQSAFARANVCLYIGGLSAKYSSSHLIFCVGEKQFVPLQMFRDCP